MDNTLDAVCVSLDTGDTQLRSVCSVPELRADTTMFTIEVDHSVFNRSLLILENGDAEAEDRVAACTELEGYFSQLVKNETALLLSPFKTHGEKLMKSLLQCLDKGNGKLRNSVLLVYKVALPLLPKGLGVGMQVASHCYSVLLKTFQASDGNMEPSCKNQTLVELFKFMSEFDEPQFLDAVMAATVRYTDHKELIEKCVNVREEIVNSNLVHKQEDDNWISRLRLEALCFAERLMQVCGSLLLAQFEEDCNFWLQLLLPSLFVFHETHSSAVLEKLDADTRKAARQTVEALLLLTQNNKQLKLENLPKIKKDITACYVDKMVKLVGVIPDWRPTWCLILDILDGELNKRGNHSIINKLLIVIERAFKHERLEVRVEALVSWRHFIDKLLPPSVEVQNNAVQRTVRLLMQPLQPGNAKTAIFACQKFRTWWHLVQRLGNCNENHWERVLVPFLVYCYGCSKSEGLPPGKKYEELHIPCAKALANVLDHEPAKQPTSERQKSNEDVEGCVIHPCEVPLLSKPAVFLGMSEVLFYSVGECVVTLSSRSELEMCSQLVHTIWTSLLRHIAAVLDGGGIPAEKVVKVVQGLLRLLQNLTTRSSCTAPVLASYCISPLLEELVMGPHAFPPVILASHTYYVGTAHLMTGTAALFLMEVMVSHSLLELATHPRYVMVLKAIMDVGVSHHNVLEFMQSVIRQLEVTASSCHDISSIERASLCIVWSNVAGALTKYLQFHMHVNQGDEKQHDLSCFYLVLLFPFYHFYSITYKQAMETLSVWLELYKCFHQAAIQSVSTLEINEVCETVAMKIFQALSRHCPTSANEAVPLLKAVQNIILSIPFSDICGTQQFSKRKSTYLLARDRGQISKPTNYITNTLTLVVKVSHMFSVFDRSGEWYNTMGMLIMNCLEALFKNMKEAGITAPVPLLSSLSDSVHNLLQINPLQDGTAKFWHESLHRMWKCYISFIETNLPPKSVKDFLLGWVSAILEAGFSHPQQEIRDPTLTFWDNTIVPALANDSTSAPEVLKEARRKCEQMQGTSCVNAPDSTHRLADDKEKPLKSISIAVLPEETDEHPKHRQSLLQQLQDDGHILTKHQKEVFRRRKHEIPVLYSSTLQPLQEDSIMSEGSQDMSDFIAPNRIIEPLNSNRNDSEAKEPPIAPSLIVLKPPSSLQRLADYHKKMETVREGSVALASVIGHNSVESTDMCDQSVSTGTSAGILGTQAETKRSEYPSSPLSATLVSHPCEPTPLSSDGRKLGLESVAVCLPAAIVVPSKVRLEIPNSQLVHEQDVAAKPEVPISTPGPTSVADSVNDVRDLLPLEERVVCNDVTVGTNEQSQLNSSNILASPGKVHEIVKLSSAPQALQTDKQLSLMVSGTASTVPVSRKSLLKERTSKKTSTVSVQKVGSATKPSKRKPVVHTENPVTNYFRPLSVTLTADDDGDGVGGSGGGDHGEVDTSRKGIARTINLSVKNSGNKGTMAANESKRYLQGLETTQIVSKHTKVLQECLAPSVSSVDVKTIAKRIDEKCEDSDGRQVLNRVKVVVERVEDFMLTRSFSAIETAPPLNVEHKELPSCEVSSRTRRKTRSPLKRNAGDPKLPPFKGRGKRVWKMKTTEQYKEVLSQHKLSKPCGRHSRRKYSTKQKAKKCPSQVSSGTEHGTDDQKMDLTVQEASSGPETALGDNPSPSLLAAACGRTSSKTKQTISTNTVSKVVESDMTILPKGKLLKLQTTDSQPEHILTSNKVLDVVNTYKHNNSKCHKPLSIKDLTFTRQVRACNLSLLHDKGQAFDVESSKKDVATSHGLSDPTVGEVGNDLNTVQISEHKIKSSCSHQSSLNASLIGDNSVTLLKDGGRSSLSKSPEILVESTSGISVFDEIKTTIALTSGEVSAMTGPMFAAIVTGMCPGEVSILPTKSGIIPGSPIRDAKKEPCADQALREVIPVTMHGSYKEENFPLENVVGDEKVISGQRSQCMSVEENKRLLSSLPCKVHTSTNKLDEHIKDTVSLQMAGRNFKSMQSQEKSTSVPVPSDNTHKNVSNRCQASAHSKESDVQEAQNQILEKNSMIKLCLRTSVQTEVAHSPLSKAEVTLPGVDIQSASSSPDKVFTSFIKVEDSEDVIESSQDSDASSSITSRLPSVRKCSVRICRIDTTLRPGVKLSVSNSDCKRIVLTPEDTGSSFKVCTIDKDIPGSARQQKPAKAVSWIRKAHSMTRRSANQLSCGKHTDVNEVDSVQDKPSVSVGINLSRGVRKKEPASEVCVSGCADNIQTDRLEVLQERFKKYECDDRTLNVATKPKSQQATDILTSKKNLSVVMDNASVAMSRQQTSMPKPEVNFLVIKHGCKQLINIPEFDNISVVDKDNSAKFRSKEQIITSENKISTANVHDIPKFQAKEWIMTPENYVSGVGKEDTPRLQSREQIITSEKNISRVGKDSSLKCQFKQSNTSLCKGNISTVNSEHTPKLRSKRQVNTSKSEGNSSTVDKQDTPKPQSGEKTNVSMFIENVSVVSIKETLKLQAEEMSSASKLRGYILPCCKEDGPKPHSSGEINMSQSEDSVFKEEKGSIRKPQSKQQLSTEYDSNKQLTSIEEGTQGSHSKQVNETALEDTVLVVSDSASKLKRKQISDASNCDVDVLTLPEEDFQKPEPEQQKSETCSVTAFIEGPMEPMTSEQIVTSDSEVSSLAEDLKARLKHSFDTFKECSSVMVVFPESQPEQHLSMLRPENEDTAVMRDDAEKSELNSATCEEIAVICITDDTATLSPTCEGVDSARVKTHKDKQGTTLVLQLSSERMLAKDEVTTDVTQQLVTPDSVSRNQCKRNGNVQPKDDNVADIYHEISSPVNQQKISDDIDFTDKTTGMKKTLLKDVNILEADLKTSFPLQSHKRPALSDYASLDVLHGQVAFSLDNPANSGASKIQKLSMQNAKNVSICKSSVCDRSVSTPMEVKLCDSASLDSDKTPSPPSKKSLVRSSRLLPYTVSSLLGSPESSKSDRSHHKCSPSGRAHRMLDCAVAVKNVETRSDVHPEEIGSSHSAAQTSLPLTRLQDSVPECQTPSLPLKRALKLDLSQQGVHPSKKRNVWFCDPELSSVMYYDSGQSNRKSTFKRSSLHSKTRILPSKRRKVDKLHAAVSSDTSIQDGSTVSAFSASIPDTESPHGKAITPESQGSPDLSGLVSQGSVKETATELLNSQDAFFPPLMNCSHPIECIAPRLMTKLKWTKALIAELTHKNIRTVGDLSRLDEASINRLPLASPKISHAKAVLQDYMKSLEVENEMSHCVKVSVNEGDDAVLEPESVPSSTSSTETNQISSGQHSHKQLSDKLFASECENTSLNAVQTSLMKRSTEEILHSLPVQSVVQYALSRLVSDTSFDVPVSHYQKFMEAIAQRLTHTEFTALFYNAVMVNSASNKSCP